MVEGPLLVTSLWAMRLEHEVGVVNGCMQHAVQRRSVHCLRVPTATSIMHQISCKCACQTAKSSTTRVHKRGCFRQIQVDRANTGKLLYIKQSAVRYPVAFRDPVFIPSTISWLPFASCALHWNLNQKVA